MQRRRMHGGSVDCRVAFRGMTTCARNLKTGVADDFDRLDSFHPPSRKGSRYQMPVSQSYIDALYCPQAVC